MNKIIYKDCNNIYQEYKKNLNKILGKKILITGGGGFLLSYLVFLLILLNNKNKKKVKITIIDKYFNKSNKNFKFFKNNNVKIINKDISTLNIKEKYEYIIHGASIASPVFYKKFPIETINSNVNGLLNVLSLNKKNKKLKSLIFMSSSEIYGDPDNKNIPTSENYLGNVSCIGPRACYDESKRLGETISKIFYNKYKFPIKIVRPFNVYGPGQKLDDGRIMPDIMNSVVNKKDITLYSNGKSTRSFCYISDQIRGILTILFNGKNGEAYNVGNDKEINIFQLSKLVVKLSKQKIKIKFKKSFDKTFNIDNPKRRCPKLNKIYNINKWRPKMSLKNGIKNTLKFYT